MTGNRRHGATDHARILRAVLCVVPVLTVSPLQALAQSASFRSVDTDSDRRLNRAELTTAFGAAGAARLLNRSDHNGDGVLTVGELRRDPEDDRSDRNARDNRDDDDRDDDNGGDEGGGDDSGDDDGGDDD